MTSPSGLPELVFVERDAAVIEANMVTQIEAALTAAAGSSVTLALGDPRRALVSGIVALLVQERQNINITGRLNLLGYSSGDPLLAVGALVLGEDADLLPAAHALTTIRFTLSATRAEVTTIASGRIVTAGSVQFETTAAGEVAIGALTVDVPARAVLAGASGNGFVAGQIHTLVEPIPFVASAANTTTSDGGHEQETEDAYRDRVRAAPSGFSVAGPTDAYVFWAKSASSAISDVSVLAPAASPGEVYIRPLLADGVIPGSDVLALVAAAVTPTNRRPLTDHVNVVAPTAANYNVTFTYYIDSEKSTMALTIQNAVDAAVVEYRAWQRAKIGRDINPDKLRSLVIAAGAKRLTVSAPSFTALTLEQVAQSGVVTVTYGGLEDA
jgi:phage-related baseplate assembly protein